MEGSVCPDLPEELFYIWSLYLDIKKGSESVGWKEIKGYEEVTLAKLTAWEASLMIDIDINRRKNG